MSNDTPHTDCEPSMCESCNVADCPSAGNTHHAENNHNAQAADPHADEHKLYARMSRVGRKIVVLSGKGGVGKSTVAVNIATALHLAGKSVGILDVDIHGPSIPTMLGVEQERVHKGEEGILPVDADGIKVMSLGFLLNSMDDAAIWRGPMKMSVIKQFLADVEWDGLDFLVIDSPPGTGDEPLSVCQLLSPFSPGLDGAVVVTTPQRVAAIDVRKSVNFCKQMSVPVIGIVENMSGFVCPGCGEVTQVFRSGGGQRIAESMEVPFLGSIPIDPKIVEAGDGGQPFVQHFADTATAVAMRKIIEPLLK